MGKLTRVMVVPCRERLPEAGGSLKPAKLAVGSRGRKQSIQALPRHYGITG